MNQIWHVVRTRPILASATAFIAVLAALAMIAGPKREEPSLYVTAKHVPSIFTDNTLELLVWHQHKGNLRNGELYLQIRGTTWEEHARWTFEEWPPNADAAIRVPFRGDTAKLAEPLVVRVFVHSKTGTSLAKDHYFQLVPGDSKTLKASKGNAIYSNRLPPLNP